MSCVDQLQHTGEPTTGVDSRVEIRSREGLKSFDRLGASSGVAVSRKVHQIERLGVRNSGLDEIVIREPCFSRGRTRAGYLLFGERVYEA